MTDPTALDYWTLAIAIVGAATGLAALAAQVWSFALSGPRVKVGLSSSLPTNAANLRWLLGMEAYNVGRLPVTITSVGVVWGRRKKGKKIPAGLMGNALVYGPTGQHRLVDGDSENWLFDPLPIAQILHQHGVRKVRGFVNLANGKTVTSRKRFDVIHLAEIG